ncbi:MAG TPA: hypothetical protein VND66_14140 [Acidobacteriaceae bacterium]|nr:hypothetical protein [Terriglobia bacterium]HVC91752.1 hypothetical protein [Acidobacteriaceae bacterium]
MHRLRTLQIILRRMGCLVLTCGLPLVTGLYAQSSSSGYNGSYYTSQHGNGTSSQVQTPRYTGHSWIDDLVLEGGAGATAPVGKTLNYANIGWNILLGTGYKFNDRLSLLAEWNFSRMTVPHMLAGVIAGVPDGNQHIWTVDLNPKFNVLRKGRADGYVIGGGGFSRALISFTAPVEIPCGYYYAGYYGVGCTGTITIAHTSTNQANLDIGIGGEWHLSPYAREKLFLEARYERLLSPNTGLPPGYNANLIPVTIGIRW